LELRKRKRGLGELDIKEIKRRVAINEENYELINEQIANLETQHNSIFKEQKTLFNELASRMPLE